MHPILIYVAAKAAAVGAWGLYRRHRKNQALRDVEDSRQAEARERAIREARAENGLPGAAAPGGDGERADGATAPSGHGRAGG